MSAPHYDSCVYDSKDISGYNNVAVFWLIICIVVLTRVNLQTSVKQSPAGQETQSLR